MKELKWFRMWVDAVDNPKLRLLAFEDRWHFVALCCLKRSGLLDKHDDPNRDRMIAVKLGVQARELDEIARRLLDVRLIDETMTPIGWDDRQFQSDTSTERVKRFRERCRNVSETHSETETETETEKIFVASPRQELHQAIIDAYHEILPNLPAVKSWNDRRKRKLDARISERQKEGKAAGTAAYWAGYFRKVAASDFLCGRGKTDWRCPGLEWLLEPKNFEKVIEGSYDNVRAA
jgi:hypothetical protein